MIFIHVPNRKVFDQLILSDSQYKKLSIKIYLIKLSQIFYFIRIENKSLKSHKRLNFQKIYFIWAILSRLINFGNLFFEYFWPVSRLNSLLSSFEMENPFFISRLDFLIHRIHKLGIHKKFAIIIFYFDFFKFSLLVLIFLFSKIFTKMFLCLLFFRLNILFQNIARFSLIPINTDINIFVSISIS